MSPDLIQEHKHQIANRALNRLLRSRNQNILEQCAIKPGDEVLFFFHTNQQSKPPERRKRTVRNIRPNYVKLSASRNGPLSIVAYEDLRLLPKSALTQELRNSSCLHHLWWRGENTPASLNMLTENDDEFAQAIHAAESGAVSAAMMGGHTIMTPTVIRRKIADTTTPVRRILSEKHCAQMNQE